MILTLVLPSYTGKVALRTQILEQVLLLTIVVPFLDVVFMILSHLEALQHKNKYNKQINYYNTKPIQTKLGTKLVQ